MEASDVLDVYRYDRSTGSFDWIKRPVGSKEMVGHLSPKGYHRLWVKKKKRYYPAHHIVWFLEMKVMPSSQIDRINGIRTDNRIENLREVSPIENSQNQRRAHHHSKSGLLGVSPGYGGKWKAQIKVNKKSIRLGEFDCPMKAHQAYLDAKRIFHPGCTI